MKKQIKVTREDIVKHLNMLFAEVMMPDYSYNGLQFEGKKEVKKIVSGVDANVEFFKEAAKRKADFALVHHGLFWKGGEWTKLDRINTAVVKTLVQADLNLYAMHLPLDAHPVFGNNVMLAKLIGSEVTAPFGAGKSGAVGCLCKLTKPMKIADFKKLVEKNIGKVMVHLDFGKPFVQNIAIVSGGGSSYLTANEIYNGEVDVLLTGEVLHQNVGTCREREVHLVSAGHYNTEIWGVKELGKIVAEEFKLEYEFIDMPTGL
jgi:dinuclear metal center YbgI/SA1388 family protein